jgi:hypothetical protein
MRVTMIELDQGVPSTVDRIRDALAPLLSTEPVVSRLRHSADGLLRAVEARLHELRDDDPAIHLHIASEAVAVEIVARSARDWIELGLPAVRTGS